MTLWMLVRYTVELIVAAFLVALTFLSGCTDPQLNAVNQRLIAAEKVAYAACLARQKAPIVAQALRDTVAEMVPGGSIAHGIIAGSCELILASPGTVTFTTGATP